MTPETSSKILEETIDISTGRNMGEQLAFDHLKYCLVIGMPGTGKSLFCRAAHALKEDSSIVAYDDVKEQVASEFLADPTHHKHPSFKEYPPTALHDYYIHDKIPPGLKREAISIWNGYQIIIFNQVDHQLFKTAQEAGKKSPRHTVFVDVNFISDPPQELETPSSPTSKKRSFPTRKPGSHSRGEYTVKQLLTRSPQSAHVYFFFNLYKASLLAAKYRESMGKPGATEEELEEIYRVTLANRPYEIATHATAEDSNNEIINISSSERTRHLISGIDAIRPHLRPVEQIETILWATFVESLFAENNLARVQMVFSLGLLGLARKMGL